MWDVQRGLCKLDLPQMSCEDTHRRKALCLHDVRHDILKHQEKIQEILELQGIAYCSSPRHKRIGGGSAITCDSRRYTMKQIHVDNHDDLEVTVAVIKPKDENTNNLTIITIAL